MKILETDRRLLEVRSAEERVAWILQHCGGRAIVSTSFGIQSAVLLHMVAAQRPDVPVVFIDTGFLFDETYRFAAELEQQLGLNVRVYKPALSPQQLVESHGELWAAGEDGLAQYNQIVKVEPMQRAIKELRPLAWLSGVRRLQASSRSNRPVSDEQWGVAKMYPLIDWTDRDVYRYLKKHDLSYHPLWEQGYVSVGDYHSSKPLTAGADHEATRFGGTKRECGLHQENAK